MANGMEYYDLERYIKAMEHKRLVELLERHTPISTIKNDAVLKQTHAFLRGIEQIINADRHRRIEGQVQRIDGEIFGRGWYLHEEQLFLPGFNGEAGTYRTERIYLSEHEIASNDVARQGVKTFYITGVRGWVGNMPLNQSERDQMNDLVDQMETLINSA